MGGDSGHPLVTAIAGRFDALGMTTATPDLPDPGFPRACADLIHAADELVAKSGAERVVLVGYSWGSAVASMVTVDGLIARVLVAPPVAMMELGSDDGLPGLVLVPAHDDFGGPDAVDHALAGRDGLVIETVDGADHFLIGATDQVAQRVVEWVSDLG